MAELGSFSRTHLGVGGVMAVVMLANRGYADIATDPTIPYLCRRLYHSWLGRQFPGPPRQPVLLPPDSKKPIRKEASIFIVLTYERKNDTQLDRLV
jgi:hypothetical protein